MTRLAPGGKGQVFCPACGKPIAVRDTIERKFESPEVKEQARKLQAEGQTVIDNESRELLAVQHTGFIVVEGGTDLSRLHQQRPRDRRRDRIPGR